MATDIIAGAHTGIPVRAHKTIAELFNALKTAAEKEGNFWALKAVRTIESLTSGHHKDSVYITEQPGHHVVYHVMMPGCQAMVLKRSCGEYLLIELQADGRYVERQKTFKAPGYFEVTKNDAGVTVPTFVPSGEVSKEPHPVLIADRREDPYDSASEGEDYLKEAPDITTRLGFGMHFTPGKQKIGGLRNLTQAMNAASDPELRESAMVLARTMAKAHKFKGITWVSERGGSGVLTQAMAILKRQGLNFEKQKHEVFFSGITTDAATAERLAGEIGMGFQRNNKSIHWYSLDQLFGSGKFYGGTVAASVNRMKYDPEHSALKVGVDVASEFVGGRDALTKVTAVTQALAVVSGAAAAGTGTAPLVGLGMALVGLAPSVYKGFFPDHYNKIKRKL